MSCGYIDAGANFAANIGGLDERFVGSHFLAQSDYLGETRHQMFVVAAGGVDQLDIERPRHGQLHVDKGQTVGLAKGVVQEQHAVAVSPLSLGISGFSGGAGGSQLDHGAIYKDH